MASYLFPLVYSLYTSPLGWYLNHYYLNRSPPPDHPQHSRVDPDTNVLTLAASNGHTLVVTPIPYGTDNYAYAIHNTTTGQALVVDAGDAPTVHHFCTTHGVSELTHVLSTHKHHDHTGGNHLVVARWPQVHVVGGRGEGVACVTYEVDPNTCITGLLSDTLDVHILGAPGPHTRHGVMYHVTVRGQPTTAMLFSGDTLFRAGVGKFFEGGAADMQSVVDLLRARAWPQHTWLYPGHEYALANLAFAARVLPDSAAVRDDLASVQALRARGVCTVPTPLAREWETNPFCRTRQETLRLTLATRPLVMNEAEQMALEGVQWACEAVMDALRRARDAFVPPAGDEDQDSIKQ